MGGGDGTEEGSKDDARAAHGSRPQDGPGSVGEGQEGGSVVDAIQTDVAVLSMAAAADIASTQWALRRCSGCYEVNPVMSEPVVSVAVKGAGVAAVALGCDQLRRRGHPGWAKALRWTVAAMWFGVAAHNVKQGRGI